MGRVWSTVLDGVGAIAFCNNLRKRLQDDQQGVEIGLKFDLFTKHKINCVDSLWSFFLLNMPKLRQVVCGFEGSSPRQTQSTQPEPAGLVTGGRDSGPAH